MTRRLEHPITRLEPTLSEHELARVSSGIEDEWFRVDFNHGNTAKIEPFKKALKEWAEENNLRISETENVLSIQQKGGYRTFKAIYSPKEVVTRRRVSRRKVEIRNTGQVLTQFSVYARKGKKNDSVRALLALTKMSQRIGKMGLR